MHVLRELIANGFSVSKSEIKIGVKSNAHGRQKIIGITIWQWSPNVRIVSREVEHEWTRQKEGMWMPYELTERNIKQRKKNLQNVAGRTKKKAFESNSSTKWKMDLVL